MVCGLRCAGGQTQLIWWSLLVLDSMTENMDQILCWYKLAQLYWSQWNCTNLHSKEFGPRTLPEVLWQLCVKSWWTEVVIVKVCRWGNHGDIWLGTTIPHLTSGPSSPVYCLYRWPVLQFIGRYIHPCNGQLLRNLPPGEISSNFLLTSGCFIHWNMRGCISYAFLPSYAYKCLI